MKMKIEERLADGNDFVIVPFVFIIPMLILGGLAYSFHDNVLFMSCLSWPLFYTVIFAGAQRRVEMKRHSQAVRKEG